MTKEHTGSEIFIVDNSDKNWKVREYLKEWADISHQFDIATGYFEIGSLLALEGNWQSLDKIRILMGDEITKRTKRTFVEALKNNIENKLDTSIENEKEKNDFLKGVPAIVDALARKKIAAKSISTKPPILPTSPKKSGTSTSAATRSATNGSKTERAERSRPKTFLIMARSQLLSPRPSV